MTDIEKLKKELIEQKQSKFPGNIYHVSQVLFAYNSNKIEVRKSLLISYSLLSMLTVVGTKSIKIFIISYFF